MAAAVMSAWWPAPAKVNRFLHVTGQRPDGMHELNTVFQLLDYGDLLRFQTRDDGLIIRHVSGVPLSALPEEDLTVQAACLLRQIAGVRAGADIYLHKRLPIASGLGGGSSDAATCLQALNELWGINYTTEELAAIGLNLGADVPVFVHGCTSWAEGTGERLTPIPADERWFLVAWPPVKVQTSAVFADPGLTRSRSPITMQLYLDDPEKYGNDCESVTCSLYPQVDKLLRSLNSFAPARLSGTGSCVFSAFTDRSMAERARQSLSTEGVRSFLACGIARTPPPFECLRSAQVFKNDGV